MCYFLFPSFHTICKTGPIFDEGIKHIFRFKQKIARGFLRQKMKTGGVLYNLIRQINSVKIPAQEGVGGGWAGRWWVRP